jgi:SAM-dependent methyltransferase
VVAQQPTLAGPDDVAIDIGCGDGQLCAELHQIGWRSVFGFDVSRARIRRARRRYPHLQFHEKPTRCTDLVEGSADLLVMDNVIEHLPRPLETIGELGTYLAPGGRIVIVTPNMESGHFRLLGRRWTPELAPHAHIYLFTVDSLCRLVEFAGLRVETTGNFHEPGAGARALLARVARGDVRGAVWRAVQDAGGVYGQLVGQGPMLYVVATRRAWPVAAAVADDFRRVAAPTSSAGLEH